MRTYTNSEVLVPYSDFVALKKAGKIQLGMDHGLSQKIAKTKGFGPKGDGTAAAAIFYSWVSVGLFLVSVYFSFTASWWWFIPGFVAMRIIWNANKKTTVEGFLSAAMIDREFYERVQSVGGWLFQMEGETAEPYLCGNG